VLQKDFRTLPFTQNSLSSAEIRAIFEEEVDSDPEESLAALNNDDLNFVPNIANEESDVETDPVVEYDNSSSSDTDSEEVSVLDFEEKLTAKNGTIRNNKSFPQSQTLSKYIAAKIWAIKKYRKSYNKRSFQKIYQPRND